MRKKRIITVFGWVVVGFFTTMALAYFFKNLVLKDVLKALHEMPSYKMIVSLSLMVVSYSILGLYDVLATVYLKTKIPKRFAIPISSISYAIGYNTGFSNIGTTAIKIKYYSQLGESLVDVAKRVGFCALTSVVGILFIVFIVTLSTSFEIPVGYGVNSDNVKGVGIFCGVLVLAYFCIALFIRPQIKWFGVYLKWPSFKVALLQVTLFTLDWIFAGAALYVLLPFQNEISFIHYFGMYSLILGLTLLSHVPGGLGVFESLMLFFFSSYADEASILGAALVYRLIYYLIPLLLGVLGLGVLEYKLEKFKST